ncbi:MAG: glycosyltransferase [Lacisediminihabitans sp.]
MQPRVTAILVARTGAAYLERTLAALDRQTRRPDSVIAVDAGSTDQSVELLAASGPTQLVSTAAKAGFGDAVAHALHVAGPTASADDWLWLLAHDNAPEPNALEQLLGAVEIAPSVAVAGPKLMRWDQPDVIAEFGESMTKFGASVPLVEGELDQFQHDVQDDVLGVAVGGMLVRRSLWTALGGFDPGLPSIDAGLDFSIRARLAGYRVVLVPAARVASAGGPERFGRRSVSDGKRARLARAAQLHRRLVYAPVGALPLHWLSLLPLAIIRSIGQLLAKRPGAVGGEFSTALAAAFGAGRVGAARRNLRRIRKLGWRAVAPLRLPWPEVRERRAQAREAATDSASAVSEREARPGFVSHGGLWVVVFAAIVGAVAYGPLIGAPAVSGGGLLPLSRQPAELWAHVGYGWREIGVGFVGAADPFSYVLALLGSVTFWSPSLSIVLLYLFALPLAALGAWFSARRISQRPWLPVVAALLWSFAPPFLGSLATGHLGATIAHILLPWLVLAALNASRSWAAAAGAALLFAAVTASAPSLTPALLLLWILWVVAQPKSVHRLIGIPVPAAALFAPLVIQQLVRGNVLGLLADPGAPAAGGTSSGWQLALGAPAAGLNGWQAVFAGLSLPGAGAGASATVLVAVLLAPLGILALLALFVPGSRRAIPSLLIALLGYATAVIAAHIAVTHLGAQSVSVWPGAGLSLFWLGLTGGAIVALNALRRAAAPVAVAASLAGVAVVAPLLGALYLAGSDVRASSGRILPAFVTVQAASRPAIGTLVVTPQSDGSIAASLQRGGGTTLDSQSTLSATGTTLSETDARLAVLAGNLASRSGYDATAGLTQLGIGFVVLSGAYGADAVHQRIAEALDSKNVLTPVGKTDNGLLWRYQGLGTRDIPQAPGNTETSLGVSILAGQGAVFGLTLLLGIPTARRRRRPARSDSAPNSSAPNNPVPSGSARSGSARGDSRLSKPATTFDEDDDV